MLNLPSRKAPPLRRTAAGAAIFTGLACATLYAAGQSATGANRSAHANVPTEKDARVLSQVLKAPIAFEPNEGQFPSRVKFSSRGNGYAIALHGTDTLVSLEAPGKKGGAKRAQSTIRMKLVGAKPGASVRGEKRLASTSNYFLGSDPANWRRNVPNYGQVRCAGVYPGVDLVYYGNQHQLEYDFVVSPGAQADKIVLGFQGADKVAIAPNGDLVMHTEGGEIRHQKPVVYQMRDGHKQAVDARYVLLPQQVGRSAETRVAFAVGEYDHSRALVIDPILQWITFAGGGPHANQEDKGKAVCYDPAGNIYISGITNGTFPVSGGYDSVFGNNSPANGGNHDQFVSKYSETGVLQWSTYLGGSTDEDAGSIAADSTGIYVVGTSTSLSATAADRYPITAAAYYNQNGVLGYAATLTKLAPAGNSLVYSSFWGGSNWSYGYGVDVDSSGDVWLCGKTAASNMITTTNRIQNTIHNGYAAANPANLFDGFAVKLHYNSGTNKLELKYSTWIGGNKNDSANSIKVLETGGGAQRVYVGGQTASYLGFPLSSGAYQTSLNRATPPTTTGDPAADAFVVSINPTAAASNFGANSIPAKLYSTYVGGSGAEIGTSVATDDQQNAYLVGQTGSGNFPLVNAIQTTFNGPTVGPGQYDGFAIKLNSTGTSALYSTLLGGTHDDWATSVRVDPNGNAYIAGITVSSNFWVMGDYLQSSPSGPGDWFVLKLRPDGSGPNFATYLGGTGYDQGEGIAVNSTGNAAVVGWTRSSNTIQDIVSRVAPVYPSSQPNYGGGLSDAIAARFDLNDPPTASVTPGNQALACTHLGGETVTFTATASDINSDFIRVYWNVDGVYYNADGQGSSPHTIPGSAFVAHRNGDGNPTVPPVTTGTSAFTHQYAPGSHTVTVTITDGLQTVTIVRTVDVVDSDPPMFLDATTGKDLNGDGDTTDPGENGKWLPDLYLDPMAPTCDFSSVDPSTPRVEDCDALTTLTGTRSDAVSVNVTRTAPLTWTVTTGNFLMVNNPTTITWTAQDTTVTNPASVAKQRVFVLDTTPPSLHIPGDKTLPADSPNGKGASATDLGILDPLGVDGKGYWATDSCSPTVTIVAFRDPSWPIGDGDDDTDDDGIPEHLDGPYPVGTTRILWIAFDENLNFVEMYQYITVTPQLVSAPVAPTARYAAVKPADRTFEGLLGSICQFPASLLRVVSAPSWKQWNLIG